MFSRIDLSAVDEGLLAFVRAVTLMRKHPRVFDPVFKLMLAALLIVIGLFCCTMFFGRSLDALTLASFMLFVAAVGIGACIVVEFLGTIVLAANVRKGYPNTPKEVRAFVKKRLADSLKTDPFGTMGLVFVTFTVASSGFFIYLFADVAVGGSVVDPDRIPVMFFAAFVATGVSAATSLYAVLTGRFVVVHGLTPAIAFTKALDAIATYRTSCLAVVIVTFIMGMGQTLLAFLTIANHAEMHNAIFDLIAAVSSASMFAIMWILQIIPYVALTERRLRNS